MSSISGPTTRFKVATLWAMLTGGDWNVSGDSNIGGDLDVSGGITIAGMLNIGAHSELTILSGEVTATSSFHSIDTQANAASDDLDTINGGSTGDILYIHANNGARTVVIKNGTGNIRCGADVTLDSARDVAQFLYHGGTWYMTSFNSNGT